jgi:hypothetical protein
MSDDLQERVDLPGGWHLAPHSDNPTSSYVSLCRPDGTHACSMHKRDASVFADAMNSAENEPARKSVRAFLRW